mgnify:FL=1
MSVDSELAPVMKDNKTRAYLKSNGVQVWGNEIWPGNSPDLNPTENLGEIVKDRIEKLMHLESGIGRYSHDTLLKNLKILLSELEFDNELFESLLCSMPERLRQVCEADGGNTNF